MNLKLRCPIETLTMTSQSHLCPHYCLSAETSAWLKPCVFTSVCDLLKCNAINHPVPWLTGTCTLPWMMLSRHDWMAQVTSSPPIYRSQLLLGSSLCSMFSFITMLGFFLLVLIYIYIMETSQRKHCSVLQSCLEQQRECLISCGLLCATCLRTISLLSLL